MVEKKKAVSAWRAGHGQKRHAEAWRRSYEAASAKIIISLSIISMKNNIYIRLVSHLASRWCASCVCEEEEKYERNILACLFVASAVQCLSSALWSAVSGLSEREGRKLSWHLLKAQMNGWPTYHNEEKNQQNRFWI